MNYIESYNLWTNSKDIDDKDRDELLSIKDDDKEIKERFHGDIEFGTAGMRGLLGVGRNRMNKYTIRKATKGYANYIKSKGKEAYIFSFRSPFSPRNGRPRCQYGWRRSFQNDPDPKRL